MLNRVKPTLTLMLEWVVLALSACLFSTCTPGPGEASEASDPEAPAPYIILTIGDSNAAAEHGWVYQLRQLRPDDRIINVSVPGNTIGFDNLGQERLNTLKNVGQYLQGAVQKTGGHSLDAVVIGLGTNDSKAVFSERRDDVSENLGHLIDRIRQFSFPDGEAPRIIVLSPPPYGPDSLVAPKYRGGRKRVEMLAHEFEGVAEEKECEFVDVHHLLMPRFESLSDDGVHLSAEGQRLIARGIDSTLTGTATP